MAFRFILLIMTFWVGLYASKEPVCEFYTRDSILGKSTAKPLYIGRRSRFGTCTDVRWSPDGRYVASIGLLDETLWLHRFDGNRLEPLRNFTSRDILTCRKPEKIVFSPDGKWLVFPAANSISFFEFDPDSLSIDFRFSLKEKMIVHDAAFSFDGSYFAYVTIGKPGNIELFRKSGDGWIRIQSISNPMLPMKPKGILFSADNRFVAIGFSMNAGIFDGELKSCLAVYPFDPILEKIEIQPISKEKWSGALEAIAFTPDQTALFSTDQAFDRVLSHSFNRETGKVGKPQTILKNPQARLSFPHGLGFSPDGKYLAVSNYGEDKITVYELNQ